MLMARLASHKMESEEDFDATRWLDRALIRLSQVQFLFLSVSVPDRVAVINMFFWWCALWEVPCAQTPVDY